MAAKDLYEKDFYKVLGVDKKAAADESTKVSWSCKDLHLIPITEILQKKKSSKQYLRLMKFSLMLKRAEYDEAVHYLNVVDFVHQVAETFKAEISQTSLVEVIRRYFCKSLWWWWTSWTAQRQDLQPKHHYFRESIFGTNLDCA